MKYNDVILCECCGGELSHDKNEEMVATIDHILPKSLFPEFYLVLENFAPLCGKCNSKKSNKLKVFDFKYNKYPAGWKPLCIKDYISSEENLKKILLMQVDQIIKNLPNVIQLRLDDLVMCHFNFINGNIDENSYKKNIYIKNKKVQQFTIYFNELKKIDRENVSLLKLCELIAQNYKPNKRYKRNILHEIIELTNLEELKNNLKENVESFGLFLN